MASNRDEKDSDKYTFHPNQSKIDTAEQGSDKGIKTVNYASKTISKLNVAKPDQQSCIDGKQALNTNANQVVEDSGKRPFFKKKYGSYQGLDDKHKPKQGSWRQKQLNDHGSKRNYAKPSFEGDGNQNPTKPSGPSQAANDPLLNPNERDIRNLNSRYQDAHKTDTSSSRNYYQKSNEQRRPNLNQNWRSNPRQQEEVENQDHSRNFENGKHSYKQQHHRSSGELSSRYNNSKLEFNRYGNTDPCSQQNSIKQNQSQGNGEVSNRYQNNQRNSDQRPNRNSTRPQYSRGNSYPSSRDAQSKKRFNFNQNAHLNPERNNKQQISHIPTYPITLDNLPYWKLYLLRSSYNHDQMVEFHEQFGSCYDNDDINKSYYSPRLSYVTDSIQEEINDIAGIFQQWTDKILTKCTDPAMFNDIYAKIRYGCSYITLLDPYIYQMPVQKFKAHFNRFLSENADQSDDVSPLHRISTGFYPIASHRRVDISNHAASIFYLDDQTEAFFIHVNSQNHRTLYTLKYDAEMKFINCKKEIVLFKLDIKNTGQSNDVRIAIYDTICENDQEIPSDCQLMLEDESPPIRRDSPTGITVKNDYRQTVSSIRHKQVMCYKLTDDVELWDQFRQAAVVDVANVIEYHDLDQATGKFRNLHSKQEITVKVELHHLLKPENCRKLAESIHSIIFTIIPKYFGSFNL